MLKVLGKGMYATAYLNEETGTVIKIPHADKKIESREIEIQALAAKVGVAPEVINDDPTYFEMELVEGKTWVDSFKISSRKFTQVKDEVWEQFFLALATLHLAGIAHRDLNVKNIYLLNDGSIKFLDYGYARLGFDYVIKEMLGEGVGSRWTLNRIRKQYGSDGTSALLKRHYQLQVQFKKRLKRIGNANHQLLQALVIEFYAKLLNISKRQGRRLRSWRVGSLPKLTNQRENLLRFERVFAANRLDRVPPVLAYVENHARLRVCGRKWRGISVS